MLTKDGNSTTDTEDGDEDARPGKEKREKEVRRCSKEKRFRSERIREKIMELEKKKNTLTMQLET